MKLNIGPLHYCQINSSKNKPKPNRKKWREVKLILLTPHKKLQLLYWIGKLDHNLN